MSATDEPKGASGAGLKPSEPANTKPTVETEKGRILANLLNTIGEQAQEIERLKRGDFTAEEFQNLCHNKTVQDGFGEFVVGCHLYQQQLFGISADEVITEVERLKDAVVDAAVDWHESGREGASHEWFDLSDKLSHALDELIEFRDIGKSHKEENAMNETSTVDRKFNFQAIAIGSGKTYSELDAVVFLAKDEAFLRTLPEYRRQCELLNAGPEQLQAVDLLIERVKWFQSHNETKVPDVDPVKEADALKP